MVERGERAREVGRRGGEVGRRRLQRAHERAGVAHERADLLADERRRLLGERLDLRVGAVERLHRRAQVVGRRAQDAREALDLAQRVRRLPERAGQVADGAAEVLLLGGERRGTPSRRSRRARRGRSSLSASSALSSRSECTSRRRLRWRSATAPLTRSRSRVRGLVAAEEVAQVAPAPAQALARAADQELQVVARVVVEDGEDLVGVDVGRRVADRHRPARLRPRRAARARVELDEHVLEPGLRPQQRARVGVDEALVSRVEVHRHDGAAVLQVDLRDVADPHARHADGLALARA